MPDRYRSEQPVHMGGRDEMDGQREEGGDERREETNGR